MRCRQNSDWPPDGKEAWARNENFRISSNDGEPEVDPAYWPAEPTVGQGQVNGFRLKRVAESYTRPLGNPTGDRPAEVSGRTEKPAANLRRAFWTVAPAANVGHSTISRLGAGE
jgi:hypothetical protein